MARLASSAFIRHPPHFFMKHFRVETRSLPTIARCYLLSQLPVRLGPFYVAHPVRSILTSYVLLLTFSATVLNARAAATETAPTPNSTQAAQSVADPSIQAAIVAAVEKDRKRYGGHPPLPATLIGLRGSKRGSLTRVFGEAA